MSWLSVGFHFFPEVPKFTFSLGSPVSALLAIGLYMRIAHTSPPASDHMRVSHAHARPLHPATLAFVPYWIVLVRVRVHYVEPEPRGENSKYYPLLHTYLS